MSEDKYKIIAIDIDGCLANYQDGTWTGKEKQPGSLLKGADKEIKRLREMGYRIIINTTRGDLELVQNFLVMSGI
jgi:hydroxymethylpyrimidine pyrophosphatase-like HAD family hydrolase